jgi:hypothetical protein
MLQSASGPMEPTACSHAASRRSWQARARQRGASFVELLVAIALIGLAIAIAFTASSGAYAQAIRRQAEAIASLASTDLRRPPDALPREPRAAAPPAPPAPPETEDDGGLWGWVKDTAQTIGSVAYELSPLSDLATLFDPDSSLLDKGIAALSLLPGPGQAIKWGAKGVKLASKAADANKAIHGAEKTRDAQKAKDARNAEERADAAGAGKRNRSNDDAPECANGACENGKCFVAGTPVDTSSGTKAIEDVRLGDRIGPASALCAATNFDDWSHLQLRVVASTADGPKEVDLELLRPGSWVQYRGLEEGRHTPLELDELGIVGTAYVLGIAPGPSLSPGDRCPVTGLIRHTAAHVIGVRLEWSAPLEVTAEHRLFSASRQGWVAAGELEAGELLQTRAGTSRVERLERTPRDPEPVFNLEVFDQHEYFVGQHQIRAHNNYSDDAKPEVPRPEAGYLGSKKHGIGWKEGPATAKSTNKPQGQWGSQADLDFAAEKAATLKPGEGAFFELPPGHSSVVHKPDGTTVSATRIWVRNNGTGTFHGAPWE